MTIKGNAENRPDMKKAESRARLAEAARTNEELAEMLAGAKEELESIKFFAYSIVHDLKQPSIALYLLTKRLKEELLEGPDRGLAACEFIMRSAKQIGGLVDAINVFIETGEAPLKIEDLDIKEVLETVKDEFSLSLLARRIKLAGPANAVSVKADRTSLIRIFRNYVENALRHGGGGLSEIRIDCEEIAGYHLLSVSDDGVGLKGNYTDIFAKFRRKIGAGDLVRGSGLGLAIVNDLAKKHGGSAWAEPRPCGGAMFCVSLPKA